MLPQKLLITCFIFSKCSKDKRLPYLFRLSNKAKGRMASDWQLPISQFVRILRITHQKFHPKFIQNKKSLCLKFTKLCMFTNIIQQCFILLKNKMRTVTLLVSFKCMFQWLAEQNPKCLKWS